MEDRKIDQTPEPDAPGSHAITLTRDDEGQLTRAFVERAIDITTAEDAAAVQTLVSELHEAELGDLLTDLPGDLRARLIRLLGERFDYAALTEMDETLRRQILAELEPESVAKGLSELESDDAVYILEDLNDEDKSEILNFLPFPERVQLERSLDYPEDSAGRRMQTDFIAVPPFWSVGQTIDYLREAKDLPDEFYEIFVVDPRFRLVGTVPLNTILRTRRPIRIQAISREARQVVHAIDDQEEVARMFERYNMVSAGVLDDADRLVGVVTIDDVVDVIQEEADEDIRRLGGVGNEEISDSVLYTARSRFSWLVVNLVTAIMASIIIALFDAPIEQMVALAVLMPIVASMGGNAGTQTMTVAVRALATRDLDAHNLARVLSREMIVALLNGAVLAILIGGLAAWWFESPALGSVLGIAMIVNMIAAGLSGLMIPFALERAAMDPAISSSVFVTTVTDVVGFLAFLGLAAWWFELW